MRGMYTKSVIKVAKKIDLAISIDLFNEPHPAVPFPATFARLVNEKFGEGKDFKIDIIAEDPVNSSQNLKTDLDKEAFSYLSNNSSELFSRVYEADNKLKITLYSADKATVPVCASCHTKIKGKTFSVGDMLEIRSYTLVYSNNVQVGKSELNANLEEYNLGKKIFKTTLSAVKKGGTIPLNLKATKFKRVDAINDPQFNTKALDTEKKFKELEQLVEKMLAAKVGSEDYRKYQFQIPNTANALRKLSNDLVIIFTKISDKNKEKIRFAVIGSVIIALLIVIGITFFLNSLIVRPIQVISNALRGISDGNLKQNNLTVSSNDEVGA